METVEAWQWSVLDWFWVLCQALGFGILVLLFLIFCLEVFAWAATKFRTEYLARQSFKRVEHIMRIYEGRGLEPGTTEEYMKEPNRWTRDFMNTVCAEQAPGCDVMVIRQLASELYPYCGTSDPVWVGKHLVLDWSKTIVPRETVDAKE